MVEVVTSLVVLGFVVVTVTAILFEGASDYHMVANRKATLDRVRLAMERVIREVRQINVESDVPAIRQSGANVLEFDRLEDAGSVVPVTVQVADLGGGTKQVQLVVSGTVSSVLEAQGANVTFKYYWYDDGGALQTRTTVDAGERAEIERIEVEVEAQCPTFRASRSGDSERTVRLRSGCYIRNLIGEIQ